MAARLDPSDDLDEVHEINVTPFIDVVLVLLIIFMVAAPLATVDVDVDLPRSTAAAAPRPDKPIFVSLRADLSLMLGEAAVAREMLGSALDRETAADREQRIFLRADHSVQYGAVMEVMNLLRAAGYRKVSLVGLETAASPSPPGGETRPP
jgi:biopolymer transport protein ExbD